MRNPRVVATFAFLVAAALLLQAAPASAKAAPSAPRFVTIVTGQRVVVATVHGTPTARVLSPSRRRPTGAVMVARVGGDDFVIPAYAQPYLRRYLDLNLFDVTALAAAGITSRIPLRISYRPGTTPKVPGIRITSASGGLARGYVTARSAQRFGAALATQAYRDQRAGWPSKSPLFGSVHQIAAAGVSGPPTVTPSFPMVTLVIRELTPAGNPVRFGFGLMMNQDDGRKYIGFIFVVNGEARVSVPLGRYIGVFDAPTFGRDFSVTERVLPVADYLVSGPDQRLRIDTGDATVSPSVTTPKPSVLQELDVSIDETDESGHAGLSSGFGLAFGGRLLLEPTPPPSTGSLGEQTRWLRIDPSIPGGRYLYDATYVDDGVPVDQAHKVPWPGGTAQIDETYLADHLGAVGSAMRFVFVPGQSFGFATGWPLPMPTHRTEYVVAPAGSTLDDVVLQNIQSYWDPGWFEDPTGSADAGTVRSATWLRNPFSLDVPQPSATGFGSACWACRSADRMSFFLYPQDGDGHIGYPFGGPRRFGPVARMSVYRNGKLLLRRTNRLGVIFPVPSGGSAYRVVSNLDRRLTGSFLSTHLHTEVTFRSAAGQGAPMPKGWYCFAGKTCTVLPVLTEGIDLHASPTGTLAVGDSTFDLTVGHIAGAEDPALTSVRVAFRRSGTSTWTTLPITKVGAGRYSVHFTAAPAMAGRSFDLQVNATDADGGALRQTTTRAFEVSA